MWNFVSKFKLWLNPIGLVSSSDHMVFNGTISAYLKFQIEKKPVFFRKLKERKWFRQKITGYDLRKLVHQINMKRTRCLDTMKRCGALIVHLFCLKFAETPTLDSYCLQSSRNLTLGAATRLLHSFFDQDQLLPSPPHPPLLLWPFWPLPPEHWIAWGLIQSFHEPRKGYGRLHPYGHEPIN